MNSPPTGKQFAQLVVVCVLVLTLGFALLVGIMSILGGDAAVGCLETR